MSIGQKIKSHYDDTAEHERIRSWEVCYHHFRMRRPNQFSGKLDHDAVQLGFYFASWGTYHGSSFPLQHSYAVHRQVIELIAAESFTRLWNTDFGGAETDQEFVPAIDQLLDGFALAYKPFLQGRGSAQTIDALITKIILGTFGCLPLCDRYFINGFRQEELPYAQLDPPFIQTLLDFSLKNLAELRTVQADIEEKSGLRYPLMKLVDMYFRRVGFENKRSAPGSRVVTTAGGARL